MAGKFALAIWLLFSSGPQTWVQVAPLGGNWTERGGNGGKEGNGEESIIVRENEEESVISLESFHMSP